MTSKIDLHIHSKYSDGIYSIEEILEKLDKKHIKVFSITDHDNMDSVNKMKTLDLKGKKYISGIEISSYYEYNAIHILGYYIDKESEELKNMLDNIKEKRKIRMNEILTTLKKRHNIVLNKDDLNDLMNANNIGKKELGRILLKYHPGKNYEEIRENLLKDMHAKTSYRMNINDVTKAIKSAGGIPILAHPKELEMRYKLSLEDELQKLIKGGIKGLEVYHSIHSKEDIKRYKRLCKKNNLYITGGSDFHGDNSHILGKISKDKIFRYCKFNIIAK